MRFHFVLFTFAFVLFFSCKKEYPIFQINGENIVKLLSIDKGEIDGVKKAFLEMYIDNGIDENYELYEKISKFYNIEGYYLRFYRLGTFGKEYARFEYECAPYSYRQSYIKNNDTIAIALYHRNRCALYTPKKYTINDKDILQEIMDTLHINGCVLYNKPINVGYRNFYTHYDDCYAIFNYEYAENDWLFVEESKKGEFFTLDGIQVRIMNNKEHYIKYYSTKRLNKEQIMKVISLNCEYENKITYFLTEYSTGDGYAVYQKTNGDCGTIFMFDENRIYQVISTLNGTFDFKRI